MAKSIISELIIKLSEIGAKDVEGSLKDIGKEGTRLGENLKGLVNPLNVVKGALAGLAAAATVGAIAGFFQAAIAESADAEGAVVELQTAVENAGGSFNAISGEIDDAVTRLQQFTRYSDDAGRRALATLIVTSGDTKASIENLGLVADIAAKKHMDLGAAAEFVGKVMAGNTSMLSKQGVVLREGENAMEALRKKFSGFAEQDGKTFQARLDQIRNAWLDVLEEVGNAITQNDELGDSIGGVRGVLIDLKNWIANNRDEVGKFTKNVGSLLEATVKFVNWVATRGLPVLAKLTATLKSMTTLGSLANAVGAVNRLVNGPTPALPPVAAATPSVAGNGHSAPNTALSDADQEKRRKAAEEARRAFQERIRLLQDATKYVDTHDRAVTELRKIESDLDRQRSKANITLEERVRLEQQLSDIQTTLAQRFQKTSAGGGSVADLLARFGGVPGESNITAGIGSFTQDANGGIGGAARNEALANLKVSAAPGGFSGGNRAAQYQQLFEDPISEVRDALQSTIDSNLTQTLGDTIYNSFATAFSGEGLGGIFKSFTKTVMAGLGSVFTDMGKTYLTYSGIMQPLTKWLYVPHTAGWAAAAIGAALIGLGGALGALGSGAGRGTADAGGFREPRGVAALDDITRVRIVTDSAANAARLDARQPISFTVIGTNDPRAQRDILTLIDNAGRRG